MPTPSANLKIGVAQIAPVWSDKLSTIKKIETYLQMAAQQNCHLVTFGESLLPGYPIWNLPSFERVLTDSERDELKNYYLQQNVNIDSNDLDTLSWIAQKYALAIYLGISEVSLEKKDNFYYCSLVYINPKGQIKSVHRKLSLPDHEKNIWNIGDGYGLQTHSLQSFNIGALNCCENFLPLARTTLFDLGENVHVSAWSGNEYNIADATITFAKQHQYFSIASGSILTKSDLSNHIPHYSKIIHNAPDFILNGGSCIANSKGQWLASPVYNKESLLTAELDFNEIVEARKKKDYLEIFSNAN